MFTFPEDMVKIGDHLQYKIHGSTDTKLRTGYVSKIDYFDGASNIIYVNFRECDLSCVYGFDYQYLTKE